MQVSQEVICLMVPQPSNCQVCVNNCVCLCIATKWQTSAAVLRLIGLQSFYFEVFIYEPARNPLQPRISFLPIGPYISLQNVGLSLLQADETVRS